MCAPETWLRTLGQDHGEITIGEYDYEKQKRERIEKIKFWTLDPTVELVNQVERMVNAIANFDPKLIKYLQSVYSGDHGQQKFRFASKLLLMYEGILHSQVYALSDVACKKDNGEVLKNTIMKPLSEGVNKIEDSWIKFEFDSASSK